MPHLGGFFLSGALPATEWKRRCRTDLAAPDERRYARPTGLIVRSPRGSDHDSPERIPALRFFRASLFPSQLHHRASSLLILVPVRAACTRTGHFGTHGLCRNVTSIVTHYCIIPYGTRTPPCTDSTVCRNDAHLCGLDTPTVTLEGRLGAGRGYPRSSASPSSPTRRGARKDLPGATGIGRGFGRGERSLELVGRELRQGPADDERFALPPLVALGKETKEDERSRRLVPRARAAPGTALDLDGPGRAFDLDGLLVDVGLYSGRPLLVRLRRLRCGPLGAASRRRCSLARRRWSATLACRRWCGPLVRGAGWVFAHGRGPSRLWLGRCLGIVAHRPFQSKNRTSEDEHSPLVPSRAAAKPEGAHRMETVPYCPVIIGRSIFPA